MTKTIELTEEQLDRVNEYNSSIIGHSASAVQLELDRQDLLNTIRTLETGRKQYYTQLLKEHGYDIAQVLRAGMKDNQLYVELKPEPAAEQG